MKLTPLDIRKQTFRQKAMRGYDTEEVRIFLDMAADEYEKLLQENGMLSEKLRYQNERLEEYHHLEKTLQSSILTAERVAAESRERARIEAQTIINDAHVRAERILEDARGRLRQLSEQLHQLGAEKDLFVQRFQALLDAHSKFLASQQGDLDAIDALDARARALISDVRPRPVPATAASGAFDEDDEGPASSREHVSGEPFASREEEPQLAGEDDRRDRESPADPPFRRQTDASWGPARYQHGSEAQPRSDRMQRTARGTRPEGAEGDDPEDGFFPPMERKEGFFELNARANSEGGPPQ